MLIALVTGTVAGVLLGVVLHRGQLCFHSMFIGAQRRDTGLLRGWLLGVTIAAVGLAVLYTLSWSDGLNRGLAFRPVSAVLGGLLIGVGMVVARSCLSGLLFKLGSGMAGASVGLVGWAVGELLVRDLDVPGPTVLDGGLDGTIPGVLGLPRLAVALVALALAVLWTVRSRPRPDGDADRPSWQWAPTTLGVGLGVAIVAGWVLARVGDTSYGPSSVGAVDSIADGSPRWWLIAFLVGIVLGALLSARAGAGWRWRGEGRGRLVGLFAGGILLGAGGWIAGGCNIGHGMSGVAQLNVSSWVVVLSISAGVWLAARLAPDRSPSGSRS